MRAALIVVVAAGCGRLGFGTHDHSDGAVSDGVLGDGGGEDGSDGAAAGCSPAYHVCDGFEANTIDTATWTADPMVTLDTTRAHRGSHSIRVHMPAFAANTNNYQTLNETTTFTTIDPPSFWIRGWFWLSALPAGANGMELVTAERPGAAGDYVFVFSDSTHLYSQFSGVSRTANTLVPVGSWFCVVFQVDRSTTNTGSLELTGDLPTMTLANVQTDAAQPISTINLGIGFASSNVPDAQPALDLWIDDVIVHSGPVTCAD